MSYIEAPIFTVNDLIAHMPFDLAELERRVIANRLPKLHSGYIYPRTVLPILAATREADKAGFGLDRLYLVRPDKRWGKRRIVWQNGWDPEKRLLFYSLIRFGNGVRNMTLGIKPDGAVSVASDQIYDSGNFWPIPLDPFRALQDRYNDIDIFNLPELRRYQAFIGRSQAYSATIFGNNRHQYFPQ